MDSTWDNTTWDGLTALGIPERDPDARPLLLCGSHRRLSDTQVEARRRARNPVIYHRKFKKSQRPGSCICDYTEFPKLLDERLASRDTPTRPPGKNKTQLLSLPAELRLQIYEDLLVAAEPIEFCPEPWDCNGQAPSGHEDENEFDDRWELVEKHCSRKIARFCSSAKILRVNKQIHAEATGIFYKGNHFSFSNPSGWVGLLLFMYTIGIDKCRLLRHITVRHPLLIVMPRSLKSDEHFRRSIVALRFPPPEQSWGFLPARWFDKGKPKKDVILVLEKITGLRELNIVVDWPSNVFLQSEPGFEEDFTRTLAQPVIDQSKFDNLSVTLLQSVRKGDKVDDLASRVVEMHNSTWKNEDWDGIHRSQHVFDRDRDEEKWDGIVRGTKWKTGEAVWEEA